MLVSVNPARMRQIREAGFNPVPLSKAEVPEEYKEKITYWLRGGKTKEGIYLVEADGDGLYLIYDEDYRTLHLFRLFKVGERVELSVEMAWELQDSPYEAVAIVKTFRTLKPFLVR
jgi:hypothetical protein